MGIVVLQQPTPGRGELAHVRLQQNARQNEKIQASGERKSQSLMQPSCPHAAMQDLTGGN